MEGDPIVFVVIAEFPSLKEGKDAEFREWFALTNKEFAKFKGFVSRRLLKPVKGGNYAAIVEFETREDFIAMHDSPIHAEAGKRTGALFNGSPSAIFYEVIVA